MACLRLMFLWNLPLDDTDIHVILILLVLLNSDSLKKKILYQLRKPHCIFMNLEMVIGPERRISRPSSFCDLEYIYDCFYWSYFNKGIFCPETFRLQFEGKGK